VAFPMEPVVAEATDGASQEDRALVERFLSTREEQAFRLLYRRHASALFRFATRLAGGREDGEDLLQETWIRAAGRLADFRWDSTLRTWLCGIAVNHWREVRRARSRRPTLALVAPDAKADPRTAEVPAPDAAMDLDRAIASLPDGYREVLVLHDVQGYTHEEIARMLEVETGTSKSQLSRARRALRERFRIDASRGGAE